jgi:outer membrane protein assembly factor BamB
VKAVNTPPAIGADGTVYVGSGEGKLYAIKADGTLKWAFASWGWVQFTSPAIGADGTVYVGEWGEGKLYAIKADGTLKWAFTTTIEYGIYTSPAIGADGTIYVGNGNSDGKLYAINPERFNW